MGRRREVILSGKRAFSQLELGGKTNKQVNALILYIGVGNPPIRQVRQFKGCLLLCVMRCEAMAPTEFFFFLIVVIVAQLQ